MTNKKTIFILSITSDIGTALAKEYVKNGYTVIGTYRSKNQLNELVSIKNIHLIYCDLSEIKSILKIEKECKRIDLKWDIFIACAGTEQPIGLFFDCDFDEWSNSIHVNAIEQLRILHSLFKYRNSKKISDIIFFAGGGANNAVPLYSAYTASKIMLTKMCELLDAENRDINIFIIGPGWVKTKIHNQTIMAGKKAGDNYKKAKAFMEKETGTKMNDIFNCIEWLIKQGKDVSGGRNVSVVHDHWKDINSKKLASELRRDKNMYKLRRFKNGWDKIL
ncbi:MAG: SDR family NAD(P)-dependent oxidoreductase [Elusimicrobia bacterium]|nr:SDR family NAD(P)-dependent oxidoreductase [Candidatus Liberimonas magnetica]